VREGSPGGSRVTSGLSSVGPPPMLRINHQPAIVDLQHEGVAFVDDLLLELGATSLGLGNRERAKEFYEDGLVLCREVGYMYRLPDFLNTLGYISILDGDYERGAALNEESAAIIRERGYKAGFQWTLDNLGWAALLQGDHERARTSYFGSLTLCKELGDKLVASESLEGMACISAAEGEAERTARLFGAAEALREAVGYQHLPEEDTWREPYIGAVRSQLDEASWEKAWAEGRAMSFDEAVSYAMVEE
jgi:tetratricopeptide (TPR) repeat protein